jgi:hypothetical protein
MNRIEAFDSPAVRAVLADAATVLEEFAAARGLILKRTRATFSPSTCPVAFEFIVASEDGSPVGKEAEAFRSFAASFGLEPDDLGEEFSTLEGETFKIVGLKTRARKRPILVESARSGKNYVFDEKTVASALARKRRTFLHRGDSK